MAYAAASAGAGDRVYVGAADQSFYCLKARDGEVDWSWRIGALVVGAARRAETNVYFVALDNVVRALDRHSGVQQWQHPLRRRAASGPVIVRGVVAHRVIVIGGDLRVDGRTESHRAPCRRPRSPRCRPTWRPATSGDPGCSS